MIEIKITTEQAKQLEAFIEDHLYLCAMEMTEEEPVPDDWSPYGIYDGCSTCDTREQLMATFDWLRKNNILDLYIEDEINEQFQTLF